MTRAVLDTSVVIALAQERLELADPPAQATISIVTLCELHHGILSANDQHRPKRLMTLDWARHRFEALPIGDEVAPRYGRLMDAARRATGARPDTGDALIAATAMAHNMPVITRDTDFQVFQGVEVVLV
jgi:predicted nucleic acid-binding protein